MILASTTVVKEIMTRLTNIGVPAYSVIPPTNVVRYVHVTGTSETDSGSKSHKSSEGNLQIAIVEKFEGDDGTMLWVDDTARAVIAQIQPEVNGQFGIVDSFNIFAVNIESNESDFLQTDTGRIAIRSLRMKFNAYEITT